MTNTPSGTWPLLVSGAQLLLATPAVLLGDVIPVWLAVGGAAVFIAVALASLVWSTLVYLRVRGTPARGVPIAGIALGVIAVAVAAGVVLPQSLS